MKPTPWRDAMALETPDPDAKTIMEIAAETGLGRAQTYRRVLALVAVGRAVPTVKIMPIAGGAQGSRRVPAYRLVGETPAKRKRAA